MGRKIMLVDIDGTISLGGKPIEWTKPELKKYLKPLAEKKPNLPIVEMVKKMSAFYEIIFITERPQLVEEQTKEFIRSAFGKSFPKPTVFMAPDEVYFEEGAKVPAESTIKKNILEGSNLAPEVITLALDDDPKVIAMWKKLKINTIQAGA